MTDETARPELPVTARVVLVDPGSMDVVWLNEAAAAGMGEDSVAGPVQGVSVTAAIPVAEQMGVPEALAEVAHSGEPRHLRTDLVSTFRGGLAIATSIYRLPGGMLLVITDNSWETRAPKGAAAPNRTQRRRKR